MNGTCEELRRDFLDELGTAREFFQRLYVGEINDPRELMDAVTLINWKLEGLREICAEIVDADAEGYLWSEEEEEA